MKIKDVISPSFLKEGWGGFIFIKIVNTRRFAGYIHYILTNNSE